LPDAFAFGGRARGVRRGFAIVTDERELGRHLLGVEVVRGLYRHRHVGLAGAEPDFADEDVLHFKLMTILARHDECARFGGGLEGVELEHPLAVRVGGGGLGLAREGDGDGFTRIGPAPDGHRLLALEDHVVGDRRSQAEAGGEEGGAASQNGKQDGQEARGAHTYQTTETLLGCENKHKA